MGDTVSTPDRFDLLHEQYLEDWIEDNRRHQYEACGIDVPVEAEVQAILRAWENGSDETRGRTRSPVRGCG